MIVLYLLAAHLVGDFLLQTRWQATGKFGWSDDAAWLRTKHVVVYCVPFVPVAIIYGGAGRAVGFLGLLYFLHFLTDAQRISSTLGDWVAWHLDPALRKRSVYELQVDEALPLVTVGGGEYESLPPNPWAPMPLLIDQTLHLCQLAVLGGVFLS